MQREQHTASIRSKYHHEPEWISIFGRDQSMTWIFFLFVLYFSFCSLLLLVNTLPELAGVETVRIRPRRCESKPHQTGGATTQPQEPRTRTIPMWKWSTVPVEGVPLPFLHSCAGNALKLEGGGRDLSNFFSLLTMEKETNSRCWKGRRSATERHREKEGAEAEQPGRCFQLSAKWMEEVGWVIRTCDSVGPWAHDDLRRFDQTNGKSARFNRD